MEENSNLTPEERESFINKRKQRFNNMKIPAPLPPVQPGMTNVKNKDMLKKIQDIRNGNLKQEFRQIENKINQNPSGHVDVPVPPAKNKRPNPNQKQVMENQQGKKELPKLEEFTSKYDPNLDAVRGLFDDVGSPSVSNYGRPVSDVDGGRGFVNDIRSKLHDRMQNKIVGENTNDYYQQPQQPQMQQIPLQSGMIMLNEEDLKKKIISIAKPVAKQVATEIIKQVLNEYLKTVKTPTAPVVTTKVNESAKNNVTQAEILPGNKIKINGKIYNIS